MKNNFVIDQEVPLVYVCLLGSLLLVIALAAYFFRGLTIFRRLILPKNDPSEIQKALFVVTRYARFQVILRGFLLAGAFGLLWLFCLNAFVWFSSFETSDAGVVLKFCSPRGDQRVSWTEIKAVELHKTRGGGRLEIVTFDKQKFYSVRILDAKLLQDLKKELTPQSVPRPHDGNAAPAK